MKDTDETYLAGHEVNRHETEDADSCFVGQNLALIRTWTTQQRRLEYASVQFELDSREKHERFMDIKRARQTIQYDENENEIDETEGETKFLHYRVDLYNYGKRIRHVMKELDGDILGIEIEERERIGGVFAPGVKS